jgi:hypothetical protein
MVTSMKIAFCDLATCSCSLVDRLTFLKSLLPPSQAWLVPTEKTIKGVSREPRSLGIEAGYWRGRRGWLLGHDKWRQLSFHTCIKITVFMFACVEKETLKWARSSGKTLT